jgi:serine/threonine-protein kinase
LRITDFGIAQIKSEQTDSQDIIGTPSYMSPEQIKQEPVTEKSDIFSLGCVLYELITGNKAFQGDNYFSIMYKIANEDPIAIREFNSKVPEILETIVKRALSKDPAKRYQTCLDMAYDLRVASRGLRGSPATMKAEDVVDYVHNVPFFENFTRDEVKGIMGASNIVKVRQGKIVVVEGDIDDSFYIILSGETSVMKDNYKIAAIKRGGCFGEMAYLSGEARAASVMADTDCILLKISATLLDKSSERVQLKFLKNFSMTLLRRLTKSNKEQE